MHHRFPSFFFLLMLFSMISFGTACNNEKSSKTGNGKDSVSTKPEPLKTVQTMEEAEPELVKQNLEHLFEVCLGGDFSQAAPLLIYRGEDKAREWKSAYNYEDPLEMVEVNKMCAKIQVILNGMESYEFDQFVQEVEGEGTWNIWIVSLKYDDGSTDNKAFAFLKLGNTYALGDID